jgi:hypothetical protein
MNSVVSMVCAALLLAVQLPTELPSTKFSSGQDIQPYFEGWIRNPDGTFDLVFGYFNRNWQEELAIPAGPNNSVEPGGADRGQPTYFLPRRQGWVYRVRVPRDFGKQVLTWAITANGKTQKAYGELMPVEEITERIIMTRGNLNPGDDDPNKPPTIAIAPVARRPGRAGRALAAVSDDGLPKPRPVAPVETDRPATRRDSGAGELVGVARPRGLTCPWMQIRGPAKIASSRRADAVADGKASVTRDSASAEPSVRATANDGALSTEGRLHRVTALGGASRPLSRTSMLIVRTDIDARTRLLKTGSHDVTAIARDSALRCRRHGLARTSYANGQKRVNAITTLVSVGFGRCQNLIVDDSPTIRKMVRASLRRWSRSSSSRRPTGLEAIEQSRSGRSR